MATVTKDKKVGDITVRELKSLIRDSIYEVVDPDYGLELRPEAEALLKKSLKSKKRTSVEKVATELGIKW